MVYNDIIHIGISNNDKDPLVFKVTSSLYPNCVRFNDRRHCLEFVKQILSNLKVNSLCLKNQTEIYLPF